MITTIMESNSTHKDFLVDRILQKIGVCSYGDTNPHTSFPYSSSKAAADLLVQAYHRTYGHPVTISRCSNNYGPYHFPEKLIPLMIANALNDKPLPVYGEGIQHWRPQ